MENNERKAVEATIATMRRHAAQLTQEAQALEDIINAQPTPGQLAKQLLDFFCTQWKLKYHEDYVVANGAKEINSFKRMLASLTAREIATRLKAYLASTDKFHVTARHSLSLFPSAINKLSANGTLFILEGRPVGCVHTPPCKNDAQHTKLKMQEARQ